MLRFLSFTTRTSDLSTHSAVLAPFPSLAGTHPPPAQSDSWQIGLTVACSAGLLVGSFFLRGILKRRLSAKSSASDAPYYDVDSLDYGFGTAGKGGGGAGGGAGPRLYPERWLMLMLYSLNMSTLSVTT